MKTKDFRPIVFTIWSPMEELGRCNSRAKGLYLIKISPQLNIRIGLIHNFRPFSLKFVILHISCFGLVDLGFSFCNFDRLVGRLGSLSRGRIIGSGGLNPTTRPLFIPFYPLAREQSARRGGVGFLPRKI